jgi:hypothetical protein
MKVLIPDLLSIQRTAPTLSAAGSERLRASRSLLPTCHLSTHHAAVAPKAARGGGWAVWRRNAHAPMKVYEHQQSRSVIQHHSLRWFSPPSVDGASKSNDRHAMPSAAASRVSRLLRKAGSMNSRWLAAIGFFCLDAIARSATILDPSEAPVTDQQYRDLGATFPSVGQVAGPSLSGSGTYIGGRWVLTAGHIAFGKTSGTFSLAGSSYSIIRAITFPGWSLGSDFNDIGLIELSSEVPGVTPALMIELTDDTTLLGQTATWVGYGQGGTGLTGATGVPGTLRGFTNVIDAFGPTLGVVESSMIADFDRPDGSKNSIAGSNPFPSALEGNVAPGDSGGAVFWGGGLVGVISYRARIAGDPSSNSDYGELSGASRLSRFTDWITEQTEIAAVPEPSMAALLAIGSLGWLRRCRSRTNRKRNISDTETAPVLPNASSTACSSEQPTIKINGKHTGFFKWRPARSNRGRSHKV